MERKTMDATDTLLVMGSNLLLRVVKEEFRVASGGRGVGPGLPNPTVTLSLLLLHSFTVTLRTPF